mgnify:CR=1 FL=1
MIVKIQRHNKETSNNHVEKFDIEDKNETVLQTLIDIKSYQDSSLTFRCGCSSGVCGSCAVRVNGVEKLACKTTISENDLIEPLKYVEVVKDLVVDLSFEKEILKRPKAFIQEFSIEEITQKDEKKIDRQSNCILCQSCYSSCPVFEVNKDFLGPYSLTRVLRYLDDKKEHEEKEKIDLIQSNGIWDCTLCGNCTMVCPQFIDPKTDIMNLRMKSSKYGYTDPNAMSFGGDFGFNPNGF